MTGVVVREVGPRDGLQSIPQIMPTEDKLAWISAEYAAGVCEIEVASLVPGALLPQMADAGEVVEQSLREKNLNVSVLIPNKRGAERGVSLGVHKLNYVLSASESHNRANVRRSTDESILDFSDIAKMLRDIDDENRPELAGGVSTAFGCSIEGTVDEKRVLNIVEALLEEGADEIQLADTVGYASPDAAQRVFQQAAKLCGDTPLAAHFHDTRGLGLANVCAALEAGVKFFDASLGGLGGCPHAPGASGNVVTEDLVFMLQSMGVSTGIDLEKLMEARELVRHLLPDAPMTGHFAKAGAPVGWSMQP